MQKFYFQFQNSESKKVTNLYQLHISPVTLTKSRHSITSFFFFFFFYLSKNANKYVDSNNIALSKNNFINFKFLMKFTIDQIKNFVVCHHFSLSKKCDKAKFFSTFTSFLSEWKEAPRALFFFSLQYFLYMIDNNSLVMLVRILSIVTSTLCINHIKIYYIFIF